MQLGETLREFAVLGVLEAQKEAANRRVATANKNSEAQAAKSAEAEQVRLALVGLGCQGLGHFGQLRPRLLPLQGSGIPTVLCLRWSTTETVRELP